MTKEYARKILQELWRGERADYESIEVKEAIDRAIRELGNEIDESRPQGEWVCTLHSSFPQYQPDEYRCSVCNGIGGKLDKFCKHCGAKMQKGGVE